VTTGWGVRRIASAWDRLMVSLGYERYGAQGGDWGSAVSGELGEVAPDRVAGVHVTMAPVLLGTFDDPTPEDQAALAALKEFDRTGTGYSAQQSTQPRRSGTASPTLPSRPPGSRRRSGRGPTTTGHPEDALTRQQKRWTTGWRLEPEAKRVAAHTGWPLPGVAL
jgi:pimeloyl-ACP methyl ester carboxylesterase